MDLLTRHTQAYGVLMSKALAMDAAAARRAATENNLIATLYDEVRGGMDFIGVAAT